MTTQYTQQLQAQKTSSFQSKGAQIMKLSDQIFKALRGKLDGCRDHNGMPMEPAKVRAIALNAAQRYLKATGAM